MGMCYLMWGNFIQESSPKPADENKSTKTGTVWVEKADQSLRGERF